MTDLSEHDNPQPQNPQGEDSEPAPATPIRTTREWKVVLNCGDTIKPLHHGTEEACTASFKHEIQRHTEGELVLLDPSGSVVDRRVKMRPRKRGALSSPAAPPAPPLSRRRRALGVVWRVEDAVFTVLDALPLRKNGHVRRAARRVFRPVKTLLTWHPFGGDGS